ncbi:hypothetical protein ACSBR1_033847 [Camellia fascicularis]
MGPTPQQSQGTQSRSTFSVPGSGSRRGVRPQISSLLAKRRRAAVCIIFSSLSEPEPRERVAAHLLSVWAGRAHEEGASSAQSVHQAYAPRGEQVEQRPIRRVYAITVPDLVPAPSLVRGTFLLCDSIANILVDTSASHSFISSAFALALGLELAWLVSPLSVGSPIGGEIVLE